MNDYIENPKIVRTDGDTGVVGTPREVEPTVSPRSFVAQVIYLVLTIISALLIIRFILSLVGANKSNGFVDFIYSLSNPLVRPFFGIFQSDFVYGNGTARFEYESIIALMVYAIVAFILVQVVGLGKRNVQA